MKYESNALEFLSESCGNDVRQCLNLLQTWSTGSSKITYMDAKNN